MSELKRLNKFISETGFCSRREADTLIEEKRVRVNGELPEMGQKVGPDDTVLIDGKPLKSKPKRVYIAYNKPVGVTCTTERKIKSNIVSAINYPERIFPIGRLDRPSEGLIFLTNEGDIVNKILRAGNNHEKEYVVRVDKPLNSQFVKRMAGGIPILGTVTKKCKVRQTGVSEFNIVLTQGLNRQIRRMCEYLGYEVVALKRVRIMNVNLNGLRPGQWRHLSDTEMAQINAAVEGSEKTEQASVDPNKQPDRQPHQKNNEANNASVHPGRSKQAPAKGTRDKRTANEPRRGTHKPKSGRAQVKRKSGTLSLKRSG